MAALFKFFQHPGVRRFFVFVVLAGVLYLFRSMMNLILLTFIFTFLMNRLENVIRSFLNRFIKVSQRLIISCLYAALAIGLSIGGVMYYPVIITQIQQIIKQGKYIASHPDSIPFLDMITDIFGDFNLTSYLEKGLNFIYTYVTDISAFGLQVILSLILSMFFLIEKDKVMSLMNKFKTSKVAVFYAEIAYFGKKFTRTFGKVLEAQFIIASINCALTTIALGIMGFPQLFGLAVMVFFLGLVPVAGVVISLIPLSIIAYSIGGIAYIVSLVLVIMIVHAIETYFLNPKLMSAKTELPIFFTFIVLIFSEHFIGIWGLIIGIPIFVFLLDILDVTNREENRTAGINK
ncbi:AI-2E family transporter [Bacillus swezeyi]|uniref:AI-2E family transporter n=1 Tax=Bacillus swezeyi TaxID=1925020 RepID=A0A1R1QK22_9BACI|nr:AI-2E family transporter [Bacillus swezeyi]MEC1260599.1 AI-2E family transporter [Bacillus swezeyi]MED2928450.1 AI-2E family transporter [Bacillus swezeyi]MED2942523.1 AI-2E family transporter [Bacillus swezeyi]MED2964077.1 AI-2E family transporter [Bacillus swezeyi]MED2978965.1 AI-2E family transporter [Bacillus swezeyi]